MAIRIYDTRTRSKRELVPLEEGKVGLYACGITPYSPSHIGHARQALSFDIVRWLRNRGFQVNYITTLMMWMIRLFQLPTMKEDHQRWLIGRLTTISDAWTHLT